MRPGPALMLVDLYADGHHGSYIRQLVQHWGEHRLPGTLDVVVSSELRELHPDIPALTSAYAERGARLVEVGTPLRRVARGVRRLWLDDRTHGRVLRSQLARCRPDHVLLLYFDRVQLSLSLGLRFPFPLRVSGIYFRPPRHEPETGRRAATRAAARGRVKRLLLRAALGNRHVDTLFCLDPLAVPLVRSLRPGTSAVVLPDGVPHEAAPPDSEEVRRNLGVEPGRKLLLMFGALARRKGMFEVLTALSRLPPAVARNTCVALVGAVTEDDREELRRAVGRVVRSRAAQVILREGFVPEGEVGGLVASADLVLLPYQEGHAGSSGVLVRAAAAGVPVLGPDHGFIGRLIRARRLGLAVDTREASALADGILAGLSPGSVPSFDPLEAARFASENSSERFAATIFGRMIPSLQEGR